MKIEVVYGFYDEVLALFYNFLLTSAFALRKNWLRLIAGGEVFDLGG